MLIGRFFSTILKFMKQVSTVTAATTARILRIVMSCVCWSGMFCPEAQEAFWGKGQISDFDVLSSVQH